MTMSGGAKTGRLANNIGVMGGSPGGATRRGSVEEKKKKRGAESVNIVNLQLSLSSSLPPSHTP